MQAGERIGVIYAVNVAGAVAGSLLTGFLLLPAHRQPTRACSLTSGLALGMGLLLLTQFPRRLTGLALGLRGRGRLRRRRREDPRSDRRAAALAISRPRCRSGVRRTAMRRSPSCAATDGIRAARSRALHQRHAPGERQPDGWWLTTGSSARCRWRSIPIRAARWSSAPAVAPLPARSPPSATRRASTSSSSRRRSPRPPGSSAASTRTCSAAPTSS